MQQMNKIRVLIADDHSVVRMGLAALLGAEDDIEVVGEAKNGDEAVSQSILLTPDVVVMDLVMPKKDGIAATAELHEKLPSAKVLVLTSYSTSDGIAHAIDAGAAGALMKSAENETLIEAIRSVHAGRRFIPASIRRLISEDPPVPELSPRQLEILSSITRGLSNDDIAKQLGISVASVKTHILALFQKLGAATRAEAVAIALRKQLLKI